MIRLARRFRVVDQAGMSLAEILIACVIIAIGLVGLLSAVPTASYGIQEGRQLHRRPFSPINDLNRCGTRSGSSVRRPARPPTPSASRRGRLRRQEAPPTFPDESPIAPPYSLATVRIAEPVAGDACGGAILGLRQVTVTVGSRASTGTGLGATKSAIVTMLIAQR